MFKDLWEKEQPREKDTASQKEVIDALKENVKQKQELIDELIEQLAQKDKTISDLEREIETISSGLTGC